MAKKKVEEVAVEEVKSAEPEVKEDKKKFNPFEDIQDLKVKRAKLIATINKLFNKEEK